MGGEGEDGPHEGPVLEKISLSALVLEAEVCTTGERKRRQGANRNGDPLDQLHRTSSRPLRAVPRPFDVAPPRLLDPHRGDIRVTIRCPPSDPQAALVPYSECRRPALIACLSTDPPVGWFQPLGERFNM